MDELVCTSMGGMARCYDYPSTFGEDGRLEGNTVDCGCRPFAKRARVGTELPSGQTRLDKSHHETVRLTVMSAGFCFSSTVKDERRKKRRWVGPQKGVWH